MASLLRRRLVLVSVVAGMFLGMGCEVAPPEQELEAAPFGTSNSELYVKSSSVWSTRSIPVCWENPSAGSATQRSWVQSAVAQSWTAASPVYFTGWGTCPSSGGGIRIRISDVGPHTKALGRYLNGYQQGMVLNFTFLNWGQSCQSTLEYCIRAIAVHEFGHALGFSHEQNRLDTPTWCDQEQGENGDWVIGPWDLDSVMNYCNPNWNGNGQLSASDIEGVRTVYGRYAVCGDGICASNEDSYSCASDCYCGDGVCDSGERHSCYMDCGPDCGDVYCAQGPTSDR